MSGETVIVVPCYNEAKRFNLSAFDGFLACSSGVSLCLVDDGSSDNTMKVLEQLRERHPARVSIVPLRENAGKAEAVRQGVTLALRNSPQLVGYWDADLATPLEAILDFRSVLLQRLELTLVMGTRAALLGRDVRRSWKRHLLGRVFATAASVALGLTVYDTQCGAKLFRVTPQTRQIFAAPFRARWIFDVEILARMMAASHAGEAGRVEDTIFEFPLNRWEDVAGSRLKPRDFLIAALDLAAIRWQYRRGAAAVRAESIPAATRKAA